MSKPLVSIITPSFQQAQWLESCINSVLNQTYENIEYIIIDGGSTDGSKEIIEKYSDRLSFWQSKKDNGQANAINIGYKKAKGEIIAYLNADDLLEPWAVETIIRVFEVNKEFAVIYGKCKTIDENNNLIKEAEGQQLRFDALLAEGMLPGMYQPACFFNKTYLDPEFMVDESYQNAFDYELILNLSSQKTILFVNKDIAAYRIHNNSKSNLNKIEAYKEKLSIQEKYGKSDFFKWKWKRLKLAVAEKTGKIANGKAAL
ncbi:MAG: glycosyltransferase family 2 protein [Bacteroidia bacterium]